MSDSLRMHWWNPRARVLVLRQAQDERLVVLLPLVTVTLLFVTAASAQTPTPVTQGPMTVQCVNTGFLAAPDVKVTEVDQTTSALAGGNPVG
jgi:hypothetical protein